jgi:hypothetical protein
MEESCLLAGLTPTTNPMRRSKGANMRRRSFGILLSILALPIGSSAQSTLPEPHHPTNWTQPKTPWGDPDLQGTWPTTNLNFSVPLQRDVKLGNRNVLTDEEYAARVAQAQTSAATDKEEFAREDTRIGVGPPSYWVERGKPLRQASLIVEPEDGRIPPLTPEAVKLAEARDVKFHRTFKGPRTVHGSNDSWIDDVLALVEPAEHNLYDRCISRGIIGSMTPSGYNNGNRIIQTPAFVIVQYEMIHETRVVPLDGRPHSSPAIRSYMGDPRGHWEGNTLVVETTNLFGEKNGVLGNGGGSPYSDAFRLVERFTRVNENTIQYEAIIDDPKTWIKPWKISFPLTRDPKYQMVEYACHEGNYALRDILGGAGKEIEASAVEK